MPGHKRARKLLHEMDPFDVDFTEIDGLDNLHHPEGILRDSMEEAAGFYGTKKTWFLVNGSSCGLLAAIAATTRIGDKILIGRNCHKAVYHSGLLRNLDMEYVYPELIPEYGIQGGYTPEKIEKALCENPDIKTVVLTSPTYDGVVSDIEKIAEIVHRHGGILIVDEAHGAHFCLMEKGPKPAYLCGADLVIESLHKTLPALTQSAVLHLQGSRVEDWKVQKQLEIFETSSPSYLLMASMDECLREMQLHGTELMKILQSNLDEFRKKAEAWKWIRLPGKALVGSNGVFSYDETKLVFSVSGANISGRDLSEKLRNDYQIELEMETMNYALALCSIYDSKEAIEKLADALTEIDGELEETETSFSHCYVENQKVFSIYEAEIQEKETISLEKALGRISGEFIYFYPPGIPVLAPGEVISKETLSTIEEAMKQGIVVNGLADYNQNEIQVIKE